MLLRLAIVLLASSPALGIAQRQGASRPRPAALRTPPPTLVSSPLATSAAAFGAANALGFGISAATGWHYHLDLLGTGVFAVAALATKGVTRAQGLSAGAVALWAGKLASFLFYRALINKNDGRLDETLSTTSGQVGFWTISFLWGYLVSLPHTLAATVPIAERPAFGAIHIGGLILFALGLAVESAADWQKWTFKLDKGNAGKFCNVGVWRLSQHPNWLGNLILWTGIFILNAPTLLAIGPAARIGKLVVPAWLGAGCRLALGAVSPLFLFALFNGQATGVPPLNKGFEMTLARFGSDPAWQAYDAKTPKLLPTIRSLGHFLSGE